MAHTCVLCGGQDVQVCGMVDGPGVLWDTGTRCDAGDDDIRPFERLAQPGHVAQRQRGEAHISDPWVTAPDGLNLVASITQCQRCCASGCAGCPKEGDLL